MTARILLLIPAVLGLAAAAPAPPAAKPAARPARTAPPAPRPAFDIQNPQTLIDLIAAAGGQASQPRRDEDAVFVAVTAAAANFSVQFAGCSPQGRACQAARFDATLDSGSPTLAQINAFNQTSVVCRIYQDKAAKAHVTYATLLAARADRDFANLHLAAWRGCLADSGAFVRDPISYLANAA